MDIEVGNESPQGSTPDPHHDPEHVWFLESLDRINRAIQGTDDLEQMMRDVLDAALEVLGADRTWLLYPADPEAPAWNFPMERTRPEFPGAALSGVPIPRHPEGAWAMRLVLESDVPIVLPRDRMPQLSRDFQIRACIAVAVHPRRDRPYVFGLQQCARERTWSAVEHRLVQEIGRRIADALTSLTMLDDLRRSESRLAAVQQVAENRFHTFVDHATDAFFLHDSTGRILDVNRQAMDSLGYPREELVGSHTDMFDVETSGEQLQSIRRRLSAGEMVSFDARHRRKDGSTFPVEIRIRPFKNGDEWFRVSLARDITERKQAEQELLASNNLLRAVIEGTSDAVYVKDLESSYLLINKAGAEIVGRPVEDIIGRTDAELFPHDTAEVILGHDRQVITGTSRWAAEEVIPWAGRTRIFLTTKDVYRDSAGSTIGTVGISRDVTQLKQLEGALQHAQKMEAVGRLAGGIAHDFNNLLTVINGYSSLLLERMPPEHTDRDLLLNVLQGGERAARLTRQLLAFGRKQVLLPQVLDVHGRLAELREMLRRLIGEHIELTLLPALGEVFVHVDPGQFEQAIVNLAINARDAMPAGGQLRMGTGILELTAADLERFPEGSPGRYVCVTVSDTGRGMDPGTLSQIFEPFFTTKPPGAGTGFGLAMVHGFVHQSGGQIEVASEPGAGTTFRLYLPAAENSQVEHQPNAVPAPASRGHETVLLAEDEDAVRALFRLALTSAGYHVLEASDGQHALDVAAQHDRDIHLLVTDMVMPRMNGSLLIERLRRLRPQLRVIAISGYPGDAGSHDQAFKDGVEFLHKPFATATLVNLVREVLDRIRTSEAARCADGARTQS